MIPVDLAEVARVSGGRLAGGADPATAVTGPVVIDSRQVAPGGLFVCLPGEHADGHAFAAAAVRAGAVAALAARDVDVPAVVVDDPQTALGLLARSALQHADECVVVGVTGSTGKTSTKDLLAQMLSRFGPVVAPENSYNNEIGLPLTVLLVDRQTSTLVCEYSARGPGHIAYLCSIAPPRIGLVLNVGTAHLGEFGSREAIAAAKAELVEALPPDGTAVLNADDELVRAMTGRTSARVVLFGASADADVRVESIELDDLARPRFRLRTFAGDADVRLELSGAHHAINATAAAAAALARGMTLADIVAGLESAQRRSAHRMDVLQREDGVLVVDDAYNANPESMRSALEAFARLATGRRRWAVLGEMRELGSDSLALHEEVGRLVAATGVDELIAVDAAAPIAEAAGGEHWSGHARVVPDAAAAIDILTRELRSSDAVLVKASNSLRLWQVADAVVAARTAGASA
ncbi:MAG TPA: UDP-N-acetylmuramoyl-tripeptide--D-alanyl-D-alanine ligase [Mycobacteriales bacterium]|nr:UDP-N-acetylmuramoyl-tripeptide--D-alanyl-D-alanine ligase [Mycobacteriales bacterium]